MRIAYKATNLFDAVIPKHQNGDHKAAHSRYGLHTRAVTNS
jgi:hypothetical protein